MTFSLDIQELCSLHTGWSTHPSACSWMTESAAALAKVHDWVLKHFITVTHHHFHIAGCKEGSHSCETVQMHLLQPASDFSLQLRDTSKWLACAMGIFSCVFQPGQNSKQLFVAPNFWQGTLQPSPLDFALPGPASTRSNQKWKMHVSDSLVSWQPSLTKNTGSQAACKSSFAAMKPLLSSSWSVREAQQELKPVTSHCSLSLHFPKKMKKCTKRPLSHLRFFFPDFTRLIFVFLPIAKFHDVTPQDSHWILEQVSTLEALSLQSKSNQHKACQASVQKSQPSSRLSDPWSVCAQKSQPSDFWVPQLFLRHQPPPSHFSAQRSCGLPRHLTWHLPSHWGVEHHSTNRIPQPTLLAPRSGETCRAWQKLLGCPDLAAAGHHPAGPSGSCLVSIAMVFCTVAEIVWFRFILHTDGFMSVWLGWIWTASTIAVIVGHSVHVQSHATKALAVGTVAIRHTVILQLCCGVNVVDCRLSVGIGIGQCQVIAKKSAWWEHCWQSDHHGGFNKDLVAPFLAGRKLPLVGWKTTLGQNSLAFCPIHICVSSLLAPTSHSLCVASPMHPMHHMLLLLRIAVMLDHHTRMHSQVHRNSQKGWNSHHASLPVRKSESIVIAYVDRAKAPALLLSSSASRRHLQIIVLSEKPAINTK